MRRSGASKDPNWIRSPVSAWGSKPMKKEVDIAKKKELTMRRHLKDNNKDQSAPLTLECHWSDLRACLSLDPSRRSGDDFWRSRWIQRLSKVIYKASTSHGLSTTYIKRMTRLWPRRVRRDRREGRIHLAMMGVPLLPVVPARAVLS